MFKMLCHKLQTYVQTKELTEFSFKTLQNHLMYKRIVEMVQSTNKITDKE